MVQTCGQKRWLAVGMAGILSLPHGASPGWQICTRRYCSSNERFTVEKQVLRSREAVGNLFFMIIFNVLHITFHIFPYLSISFHVFYCLFISFHHCFECYLLQADTLRCQDMGAACRKLIMQETLRKLVWLWRIQRWPKGLLEQPDYFFWFLKSSKRLIYSRR